MKETTAAEIMNKPTSEWSAEDATIVQAAFDALMEDSRAASKRYRELTEAIKHNRPTADTATAELDALIVEDDLKATKRRVYLRALCEYSGLLD